MKNNRWQGFILILNEDYVLTFEVHHDSGYLAVVGRIGQLLCTTGYIVFIDMAQA